LHLLDAYLQRLEDAHERGEARVSRAVASEGANLVPGLASGMLISDALDLIFREQERWLRPAPSELPGGSNSRIEPTRTSRPIASEEMSVLAPDLTSAGARELTDKIKSGLHQVSVLLLEAHDRRAWSALGYHSWSEYVRWEIKVSRSRAYELLDHGRVLRALASAAHLSGIPDISPYAANQVRPYLGQLVKEIRTQAAGLAEPGALDVVAEVVERFRTRLNRQERHASVGAPDRIDVGRFMAAVECLAVMPPASSVVEAMRRAALDCSPAAPTAARWLQEFVEAWSESNPR